MLIKPHKVAIRRSFHYGIWLQHRTSAHQTQFHVMLHRLQVIVLLAEAFVLCSTLCLKKCHYFNRE